MNEIDGRGGILPVASGGAAAIAAQLRTAILDGEYGFGERLPAERHLASHFGASRSTVREALRQLEDMDLVSRKVGSGTFVSYRLEAAERHIAELTSPLELIEVRMATEPHIARLAVAKASGRDLERLVEAEQAVVACGNDAELFSHADEQFHLCLAECTRNPLMFWLYQHINNVRCHDQWNLMKDKILTPARIATYNRQHGALVQAIRRRDVDAADRIVREHLETARADLVGAHSR